MQYHIYTLVLTYDLFYIIGFTLPLFCSALALILITSTSTHLFPYKTVRGPCRLVAKGVQLWIKRSTVSRLESLSGHLFWGNRWFGGITWLHCWEGSCSRIGKHAKNCQPEPVFTDLALAGNSVRTRCALDFPGLLETSLRGPLHKGALRLMRIFWPSQISAPTGTDALQIALDPGKLVVFSLYNYTQET
jgi:hypothetical protein